MKTYLLAQQVNLEPQGLQISEKVIGLVKDKILK